MTTKNLFLGLSKSYDIEYTFDKLTYDLINNSTKIETKLRDLYKNEIQEIEEDLIHYPNSDLNKEFFIEKVNKFGKDSSNVFVSPKNNLRSDDSDYRLKNPISIRFFIDYTVEHLYEKFTDHLKELDNKVSYMLNYIDDTEKTNITHNYKRFLNKMVNSINKNSETLAISVKVASAKSNPAIFKHAFDLYLWKVNKYVNRMMDLEVALEDGDLGFNELYNSFEKESIMLEEISRYNI